MTPERRATITLRASGYEPGSDREMLAELLAEVARLELEATERLRSVLLVPVLEHHIDEARLALSSRGYCGDGALAPMIDRALTEADQRDDFDDSRRTWMEKARTLRAALQAVLAMDGVPPMPVSVAAQVREALGTEEPK